MAHYTYKRYLVSSAVASTTFWHTIKVIHIVGTTISNLDVGGPPTAVIKIETDLSADPSVSVCGMRAI